jgi:serine protease Do
MKPLYAVGALCLGLLLSISLLLVAQVDRPVHAVMPRLLGDGDSTVNRFDEATSARLYAVTGRGGENVTIRLQSISAGSNLDPYLVLLGAGGEIIAADDDSGGGRNAVIRARLPREGTYYVLATSLDTLYDVEADEDTSALSLYRITVDGGCTPGVLDCPVTPFVDLDARWLSIGESTLVVTSRRSPLNYFAFRAREGDVLDIATTSTGAARADTVLHIFDQQGTRLAVCDDHDDSLYASVPDFQVPRDGVYFVVATTYIYPGDLAGGPQDANIFRLTLG